MNKREKKGKLIVFEGIDGCGKGTQLRKLEIFLTKNGIDNLLTCEHSRDLAIGKLIEKIVNREETVDPLALQLCFTADRVDHYKKVIEPAIKLGKIVICDRYYGSTVAYTEKSKKEIMLKVNENVVAKADLTFFLDIDPALAIKRIAKGREIKTIFEKTKKLEECRKSYWWFFKQIREKIVIDGSKDEDVIHQEIISSLKNKKII